LLLLEGGGPEDFGERVIELVRAPRGAQNSARVLGRSDWSETVRSMAEYAFVLRAGRAPRN
jgi:hypothetical protein